MHWKNKEKFTIFYPIAYLKSSNKPNIYQNDTKEVDGFLDFLSGIVVHSKNYEDRDVVKGSKDDVKDQDRLSSFVTFQFLTFMLKIDGEYLAQAL